MTYLLDTAPFLWAATSPSKLSRRARRICEAQRDTLVVSVASLWEIAIKSRGGALKIPDPARTMPDWLSRLGARVLDICPVHAYAVYGLPAIHRDPFDRLLVAQSIAEDLPIVTSDEYIARYPVRCVW